MSQHRYESDSPIRKSINYHKAYKNYILGETIRKSLSSHRKRSILVNRFFPNFYSNISPLGEFYFTIINVFRRNRIVKLLKIKV